DERGRAVETLHSTAAQAAELARDAHVRLLALTHLSTRYFGPELVEEATAIFPETVVPRDFDVIEVPFPERAEPRRPAVESACGNRGLRAARRRAVAPASASRRRRRR